MSLVYHLLHSLYRLTAGYTLASVVGIALGIILSKKVIPWADFVMGAPTMVWVPVFLVTLGLGSKTVIAAVFISAVFVVIKSTVTGISGVEPEIVEAAQLDGATGIPMSIFVLLPCAWLTVSAGLRLAVGYAWRALIGAEILAAMVEWGIGKMIWEARFWGDMGTALTGLTVIALCGAILDRVLGGVYATD